MPDILQSIATRKSTRWGIGRADRYLKDFAGCWGDGFCPTALMGKSPEDWSKALKEAENRLVYCAPEMNVRKMVEDDVPDGACMAFNCIVTSTRKDRDGDILEVKGAVLDHKMPLLSQHNPLLPIGKFIKEFKRTNNRLPARFAIIDNELGRDHAVLAKFGALRISHGFFPTDYEPLEETSKEYAGWHILKYDVLEVSLVSIPSNIDAEILETSDLGKSYEQELDGIRTAFGRGALKSDLMRGWAKRYYDARPAQGRGAEFKVQLKADTSEFQKAIQDAMQSVDRLAEKVVASVAPKDTTEPCSCKSHQPKAGRPQPQSDEDLIRWNRQLSKSFDVSMEYLQPSKLEYDWVSRYIGCEVKQIFQNSTLIPSARMGSFLTGLRHITADSKADDIRNISGDKERPPAYEVIRLNSKLSDDFLIDGITFYAGPKCKYCINLTPSWNGLHLTLYTSVAHKDVNREIIDKAWQWAIENNFLKGEAFSLSGEFIPRTSEKWEDVFLPEQNEKPLRRAVSLINAKGKAAANRGMILMGPPGTGKTLSGRILKNEAQATFIWLSSRDFYYAGAFGGFTHGFDLARELAPSILFIEDVDNWLSERSLDLLKTEMDGIGRSSGVTTILTTNFPERLPEALIDRPGRFHDVLKFDLPTAKERERMLRRWLDGISDGDLRKAIDKTSGYSGAHLYELANFAKTIQEQDELELSTALVKALEKIAEQRELITDSQLAGSRYQPRKDLAVRAKAFQSKEPDGYEGRCPHCSHTAELETFRTGRSRTVTFDEAAKAAIAQTPVADLEDMKHLRNVLSACIDAREGESADQELEELFA